MRNPLKFKRNPYHNLQVAIARTLVSLSIMTSVIIQTVVAYTSTGVVDRGVHLALAGVWIWIFSGEVAKLLKDDFSPAPLKE